MNQHDLAEIKRRLNPDKRNPSLICGCYVDYVGNPITSFALPVATLYEQENEKYMSIFKKVLSGQIGQTLNPIAFPAENDDLLLRVRNSGLNDEEAVQTLFTRLIAGIRAEHPDMQSVEDAQTADNWLILLMHDDMDVRRRDINGEIDHENSDRAFSYFLCAVCPVKQEKPALRYVPSDSIFHERAPEWLAGAPALGFLFPLYEGGAADVNTILFFSKDCNDAHADFLKAALNVEAEMPAAEQTDHFQALLAQSLGAECSLDIVQEMHGVVSGLIDEQDKDAEPLMLAKQDVARILTDGGISAERVEAFQDGFDKTFGAGAVLPAVNIVAPKQFKVDLPSVSIKVDPKQADLLETRVIDGRSYLLIPIEGDIAVNGQPIFPSKS
ncbi:MAG: DUF4317 domain-containing protein [Clostridia bacterium]|jgi:hypothetical protein|nr:DUF4317 domain-containing protein [Clostridia bacterium]